MKRIELFRHTIAKDAFRFVEQPQPAVLPGTVRIKVAYSGLNFADVMARKGLYQDAPPLPSVLGYDVSGTIESVGEGVTRFAVGDRVAALTRFGGYSEYAVCPALAVMHLPRHIGLPEGTALATQYGTAYYSAALLTQLQPGEKVLIQSAAGGVGTALVQYALHRQCEVFGTTGSPEKMPLLEKAGVQHPINLKEMDFFSAVQSITHNKGIDVVFDAVGGSSVKKGVRLLRPGGRLICYGASAMTSQSLLGKIRVALGFGWYHPISLMMPSKSLLGVNMLHIGDERPELLQLCLSGVTELAEAGVFQPHASQVFPVAEIAQAHELLEKRGSVGKIVLQW